MAFLLPSSSSSSSNDVDMSKKAAAKMEEMPSTFRRWVSSHYVSTLACLDFNTMIDWPYERSVHFSRLRFCCPAVGQNLFEIQSNVRELQAGLENESSSFLALYTAITDYATQFPTETGELFRSFFRAMARKLGEGMLELLDPGDGRAINKEFNLNMVPFFHMPDDMKRIVSEAELSPEDLSTDRIHSLNAGLFMLVNVGFLATYHYSIMHRHLYGFHFRAIMKKCFDLSQQPVLPYAAALLYATVQADEKKASRVIEKCAGDTIPNDYIPQIEDTLRERRKIQQLSHLADLVSAVPRDGMTNEKYATYVCTLARHLVAGFTPDDERRLTDALTGVTTDASSRLLLEASTSTISAATPVIAIQ